MIYLDTSAMVKLVIREQESDQLIEWLNDVTDDDYMQSLTRGARPIRIDCCTAQIGHVELMRVALRLGDSAQPLARGLGEVEPPDGDAAVAARRLLDKIDTLLMTPEIADLAKTIPPAELCTLDAIHLATVLANNSSVTTVCAYDRRLIAACEQHGLAVIAPGAALEGAP
ncbi:MAG: type II toxin-antitoxin system VapC family toxin [Mycobacterium sp.]